MIRKIIKYAFTGFIIGMAVGNIITIIESILIGGGYLIFPDLLMAKAGNMANALAIQTFMSGVHGAICFAGVFFYHFEEWSMTRIVITHYMLIMISFVTIGSWLGWISLSFVDIGMMAILLGIAYFIVWMIMYLRCLKEVNMLNDMIGNKCD